jgi:ubiquinone/menaquinone biosynthesis C-methylase UbiE
MADFLERTRDSYDAVATDYAVKFSGELEHKPLDRALLDRLAIEVGALGAICDLGCGPGHVARYLHWRHAEAIGMDISPKMIVEAQRRHPGIRFEVGNLMAPDVPDESWGGIAAFYSLIHVPREGVPGTLAEWRRVLMPSGWLLVGVHGGTGDLHVDDWSGHKVSLDFTLFQRAELEQAVAAAGFVPVQTIERPPVPDVEYPTPRLYVLAQNPGGPRPPGDATHPVGE